MKKAMVVIGLAVVFGLSSCKNDPERSKIIQSFPIDVSGRVLRAEAVQQYVIVNNLSLGLADSFVERIRLYSAPTYPELTSIGGKAYRATISDSRSGTVSVDFRFFDGTSNPIDPVVTPAEGLTLGSIHLEIVNGASNVFSYSGHLLVTLETAASLTSSRIVQGTSTYTGSGYTVGFTVLSGSRLSGAGLVSGGASADGTGPEGALSSRITFDSGHNTNGSLIWGDEEASIHLDFKGRGVVVTSLSRIPLP